MVLTKPLEENGAHLFESLKVGVGVFGPGVVNLAVHYPLGPALQVGVPGLSRHGGGVGGHQVEVCNTALKRKLLKC